jgi:2-polyprenyl-3-methyl-5-hydroxy-6-metoxy-1,4-benzoquinol methylase
MSVDALTAAKRSHANTDRRSRDKKARRITGILKAELGDLTSKDVLDIGTGSGVIASTLRRVAGSVVSVDVTDDRIVRDFEFVPVQSEMLPFLDEMFDAVISNHVIEHVDDQLAHLLEVQRVLRPDGVCYLATPSKYWPLEPHFRLPLLSYLPQRLADAYVRLVRRGTRYDVRPLTFARLRSLARRAGLTLQDISPGLARAALRERLGFAPAAPLRLIRPFYPSHIALLRRT